MKKFLKKISCFALLLILFNCILYLIVNGLYFKGYKEYSLEYKSYIFADSHGLPLNDYTHKHGIYNFSEASESYFDIKRKIEFLDSEIKIDTVYITVDNHTLSPYRESLNNLDRSILYTLPANYNNYFEYVTHRYINHYCVFLQPKIGKILLKYAVSFFFKKSNSNKSWDLKSKQDRLVGANKRITNQFYSNEESLRLKKELIEIIEFCDKKNITLIGVKFPLTNEYVTQLKNRSFKADEVFLTYGLKVFDFQNIFDKKDRYFLDQDHLNDEGGATFVDEYFMKKRTLKNN